MTGKKEEEKDKPQNKTGIYDDIPAALILTKSPRNPWLSQAMKYQALKLAPVVPVLG